MQSFLITHTNPKTREEYIASVCKKENINPFDIVVLETEKSIGIEDIRLMQKKVYLTPLRGKKKAVIIKNAHNLTVEAQNALLKLLEEPPKNTLFFLSAQSKDVLLTTVCSRCTIYDLLKTQEETDLSGFEEMFENLQKNQTAYALKYAQELASSKDQALESISLLSLAGRNVIRKQIRENKEFKQAVRTLQTLQKGYMLVKTTNVSPRLLFENLFLETN